MLDGLSHLASAFAVFANFETLLNVCWATFVGIIIGALPGLTATMGVALLTTLTYKMDPSQAILVLISAYVGAIYGGSVGRPRTAASACIRTLPRGSSRSQHAPG